MANGIEFDKYGRVIVTDAAIAEQIGKWAGSGKELSLVVRAELGSGDPASGATGEALITRPPVPLTTCPNGPCPLLESKRFRLNPVVAPKTSGKPGTIL